jgi:hypothetical protein
MFKNDRPHLSCPLDCTLSPPAPAMLKPVPPRGKLDELSDDRAILTLSGKFIEDEGARLPLRHKIMRNRIAFAQNRWIRSSGIPTGRSTRSAVIRFTLWRSPPAQPCGFSVDRRSKLIFEHCYHAGNLMALIGLLTATPATGKPDATEAKREPRLWMHGAVSSAPKPRPSSARP